MSTTDTTTHDQTGTPDQQKFSVLDRGAVAFGAILIPVMYTIILAAGLITLGLVEIRQVNMVNFNALIANLEQRDRVNAELPDVLARVRKQHKRYDDMIARSADCFSVPGTILDYEPNNRDETLSVAANQKGDLEPRRKSISCDDIQNRIRDHANYLLTMEDRKRFELANSNAYYLSYVDGITQKMPQIIPALRFLDSGQAWIDFWARSSFEIMEMFLLVSMGMLGGIINATRWLVDRASDRPSLLAYFYKPAVGGAIALGAFVVFRATQLIVGGQVQDGAVAVTASVYLLAGLGLVSGFCADKALGQLEKAADGLFHSETQSGAKVPDPIDHPTVPAVS
jgi:hypothetical protein